MNTEPHQAASAADEYTDYPDADGDVHDAARGILAGIGISLLLILAVALVAHVLARSI